MSRNDNLSIGAGKVLEHAGKVTGLRRVLIKFRFLTCQNQCGSACNISSRKLLQKSQEI